MIVACRMPPCHLPRCILIRPSRVCWLQHSGSLHKRGQIVTWRWTPGFYVLCENTLHEFAGAMPMPLLHACSPTCTSLIARVRVLTCPDIRDVDQAPCPVPRRVAHFAACRGMAHSCCTHGAVCTFA